MRARLPQRPAPAERTPTLSQNASLLTSAFDYDLPPERIAQEPVEPRDSSRLLVLDRSTGALEDRHFRDLPALLEPGDLLVYNDSRVIPARLRARKATGGHVEIFLLRREAPGRWQALARPARRVAAGTRLWLEPRQGPGPAAHEPADVLCHLGEGRVLVQIPPRLPLKRYGLVPLPPYIHQTLADESRYQTVYSRRQGSVAAPTAGLHFTAALLAELSRQGVKSAGLTLHIGADTFRPIEEEDATRHPMHSEAFSVPRTTWAQVEATRAAGHRIVAVGTTATRALESAARRAEGGAGLGRWGWTDLYIYPGYTFQAVDALVTNFHAPRSTVLLLAAAFAGREALLAAYQHALAQGYRFLSFGDAMLIV